MDHIAYQSALREHVGLTGLAFDAAEYHARQRNLRTAIAQAELDALLVTDAADICYLTGYATFEVSVHTALLVLPDRLALQVPSIETGPAVTGSMVDEVGGYRWEGPEAIVAQIAGWVRDAGSVRRLGVDRWSAGLRSGVDRALAAELPEHELIDASGLVDELRIVKSDAELEMLALSARATGAGLDAAAAAVRAGVTDNDVAATGAQALLAAGSEFMSMQPIVVAGMRSSIIHLNHRRHRIEHGDPVFLEFGAVRNRYTAPMMRTVIADDEPTAEMTEVHAGIRDIYAALTETMRPDRTFDDAARAADEAFAPLAERCFFSGVYGYTVGIQFPPSWVEGSGFVARGQSRRFEPDMVFHLPLCLRVPGQWGIGMSETVRVTETGAVPITRNTWSLTAR